MAAGLTTHILDTASGRPGAGIRIELYRLGGAREKLLETVSNADGRTDAALLEGEDFQAGIYELVFHLGAYFRGQGHDLAEPPFLDQVPIRFAVAEPGRHYHVPLLASPYGYSTYRGS